MIDLNNISVWEFFENVSKTDSIEEQNRKNRYGGSLGMAVSVRAPSESNKYRNSKSELKFGQSNQLKELFKNDMINLNVLPKIRPDPQNYSRLNQLESLVDVFDDIVDRASVSTNSYSRICCYFICCCKCVCFRNKCRRFMNQTIYRSSNEVVFGELTQSKLIMERNFEGK